jgi:hypothetical protein
MFTFYHHTNFLNYDYSGLEGVAMRPAAKCEFTAAAMFYIES